MHIPDGFLDAKTAIATAALSATGVAHAVRRARVHVSRRQVPLLGLAGAFVFAAQMLNFPVAAGTSGHLMGSVLCAVLLGPAPALIVMTSVLLVQALVFADGGVLAFGANVFNMAIVGTLGGYGVYTLIWRLDRTHRGRMLAAGIAAWVSTVLSAMCVAGELAWSGTAPWYLVFPAMASIHAVIGVGETAITILILAAVAGARPELMDSIASPSVARDVIPFGLILTAGLVLFVAPFASGWPDGLEHVASLLGFDHAAASVSPVASPLAGYELPGLGSAAGATAVAGAIGALLTLGLSFFLARMLSRNARSSPGGP